jgi:hypothetical protein
MNGDQASAPTITTSLLYHAKIYVFAEKYLIDNLRTLYLRELHADLLTCALRLLSCSCVRMLTRFLSQALRDLNSVTVPMTVGVPKSIEEETEMKKV